MSPELIGIFAVGRCAGRIELADAPLRSLDARLSSKMDTLSRDQRDLRERVARIEVWLEVLLGGHRSIPPDQGREAMAMASPTTRRRDSRAF